MPKILKGPLDSHESHLTFLRLYSGTSPYLHAIMPRVSIAVFLQALPELSALGEDEEEEEEGEDLKSKENPPANTKGAPSVVTTNRGQGDATQVDKETPKNKKPSG